MIIKKELLIIFDKNNTLMSFFYRSSLLSLFEAIKELDLILNYKKNILNKNDFNIHQYKKYKYKLMESIVLYQVKMEKASDFYFNNNNKGLLTGNIKEDFNKKYENIIKDLNITSNYSIYKKLYKTRNDIIHSDKDKEIVLLNQLSIKNIIKTYIYVIELNDLIEEKLRNIKPIKPNLILETLKGKLKYIISIEKAIQSKFNKIIII